MGMFSPTVKDLKAYGITHDRSEQPFNKRSIPALLFFGLSCLSHCLYIFFEAKSFWEYVFSIYFVISGMALLIMLAIVIWRMKKLFDWTVACDEFAHDRGDSASETIYDETTQQIGKWSKIIHLAVGRITPLSMVWPKTILCLLLYQLTDLGIDAFELPVPMW